MSVQLPNNGIDLGTSDVSSTYVSPARQKNPMVVDEYGVHPLLERFPNTTSATPTPKTPLSFGGQNAPPTYYTNPENWDIVNAVKKKKLSDYIPYIIGAVVLIIILR